MASNDPWAWRCDNCGTIVGNREFSSVPRSATTHEISGLNFERKLIWTAQGTKAYLEKRTKTVTRPPLSGDDASHSS